MPAFTELFGSSLLGASLEKKDTSEALASKAAVAIYFSAHWCPPCRGFTPKLAEWYKKDLQSKGLEVVFVSSDRDEASFKEYFAEQPWLALPFEDRETKDKLSKKFKVQGIPSLVILDSDGKTITTEGRQAVAEDPTGTEFPWKPTPLKDLLGQAKLISASGETSLQQAIENKKALALYFSAHWCPPCRGFTPKLAEWYKKDLQDKGLEVVFVSSDRDENSFKEYFAEQPWLALEYTDRKLKEKLSSAFKVNGIPSLVILDSELNVVTTDGRSAVSADPEGVDMPWWPKPVKNLKAGPGNINQEPTVFVFCETSEANEKRAIEEALEPIAKRFLDKQKASGENLEVAFMVATDPSGLAPRIRGMLGLPALLPHILEKKESSGDQSGAEKTIVCRMADPEGDAGIYRGLGDAEGKAHGAGRLDYDDQQTFVGQFEHGAMTTGVVYDSAGKAVFTMTNGKWDSSLMEPLVINFPRPKNEQACDFNFEKMAPRMALIDIPSEGAYYLADESAAITTSSVEEFVANFQAGKLERKQLS